MAKLINNTQTLALDSDSDSENTELPPSDLGTKSHWDNTYAEELENFQSHAVIGDSWFGKNIESKIINYIKNLKLNLDTEIVDVGCGNGSLLIQLAKCGFSKLTGIDYSANAIELAKGIAIQNGLDARTSFLEVDMLKSEEELDELKGKFRICVDKGTYDAISLMDNQNHSQNIPRIKYLQNIRRILSPELFIVVSCNWTEEELTQQTQGLFNVKQRIETEKFRFGGQAGNSVTIVVFSPTEEQ